MSSQSGITATTELIEKFKEYITSNSRALFISIENEQLVPKQLIKGSSNSTTTTDDIPEIASHLTDTKVTYLIIKKDEPPQSNKKQTKNAANAGYFFISYVPDPAPVREKMLYASSKNALLRELGLEYFTTVLFINDKDELSTQGWAKILDSESATQPLTESEKELAKLKDLELVEQSHSSYLGGGSSKRRGLVSVASGAATSSGSGSSGSGLLQFKIDDEKLQALISSRRLNGNELITIEINPSTESFYLSQTQSFTTPKQIPSLIPTTNPNFNVFTLDNGLGKETNFFIYSCPSGSKVRDRMQYAANKQGLISIFKDQAGLQFEKVIEVGDSDEIELSLFEESGSAGAGEKKTTTTTTTGSSAGNLKFSKPKGPRRR
ncbi:unnamed protein product [Ambrosiozyma monospora]|uniref:Unnamed protein product n=1 Tax=Ambrosiozyma monospora TaxID=43982 RepID=A0ACB5T152_AMBMO|nr:unnamed protein product [Ambrosiozyma monospora]